MPAGYWKRPAPTSAAVPVGVLPPWLSSPVTTPFTAALANRAMSTSEAAATSFITGDDWSFNVTSGTTGSDDCEGVGAAAAVMLESTHDLLQRGGGAGMTEELAALKSILERFEAVMIGGTVSEPMVDTAATVGGAKPHLPMPVTGARFPGNSHL